MLVPLLQSATRVAVPRYSLRETYFERRLEAVEQVHVYVAYGVLHDEVSPNNALVLLYLPLLVRCCHWCS
jgi:hypothetical protein